MATALLVAALAIVAWGWATGKGFAGRIAALAGRTSRPRMIVGWAAGTFVTFGWTSATALILLGDVAALWRMPPVLRVAAWRLGLPADADRDMLAWIGGSLVVGIVLGVALLALRRRRGRPPIGLKYRSPAAAQGRAELLPAALLAVSAGVSEEAFFRLLLPLLVALVTGSAMLGLGVGLVAFVLLHRHQGRVGMVAVGFVGGWLTYLYLLTGALWLVMALHALIDVHALVLRPWISGGSPR